MTGAFVYLYRLIVFMVTVGIIIAVLAVGIAVALVAVLLAVVYGFISPTRTPASCLRSLALNTREGIAHVQALNRSGRAPR
jgi:hypothetical protein